MENKPVLSIHGLWEHPIFRGTRFRSKHPIQALENHNNSDLKSLPDYSFNYSLPDYLGVSENSVPLNPMVLLIIILIKWLFVWEYTLFSDNPI